ncbi:hypothetical protein [Streptomyces sp. NPDC059076]|uniref:hypothetical protein n=1 Tax=unclassified Streptomyces TaxID=2593676 RepID=UPI0036BF3693
MSVPSMFGVGVGDGVGDGDGVDFAAVQPTDSRTPCGLAAVHLSRGSGVTGRP